MGEGKGPRGDDLRRGGVGIRERKLSLPTTVLTVCLK